MSFEHEVGAVRVSIHIQNNLKIITRMHIFSDYLNACKDRTQERHKNKKKQTL